MEAEVEFFSTSASEHGCGGASEHGNGVPQCFLVFGCSIGDFGNAGTFHQNFIYP